MNIDGVIQKDWATDPLTMQACLQLWHSLSERDHQLEHYTFSELAQLANTDDESRVSKALLYLATPKLKVLKTCLMYEFNGNFSELPDEEIMHYWKGEPVIHPEYGERLPESEILLCFTPGARLQNRSST